MAEPQVNAMQLDYSAIIQKPHVPTTRWQPPPHKFFGRKDAEGMPTPEPVYEHQDYPAMRYKANDGKISVVLVENKAEDELFKSDGYKTSPAAFGYVGAPDIQTVLKMRQEAEDRKREAEEKAKAEAAASVAAVSEAKGNLIAAGIIAAEAGKKTTLNLPEKQKV